MKLRQNLVATARGGDPRLALGPLTHEKSSTEGAIVSTDTGGSLARSSRVAIAVIMFLLASTSIESIASFSTEFRVAGILVIWSAALSNRCDRPRGHAGRGSAIAVGGLAIGNVVYLAAATLPHGLDRVFLLRLTSVALFLGLCTGLRSYSQSDISKGVLNACLIVVAWSVAWARLRPASAIEQGRLRGVLENANFLGFVASLLIAISVSSRARARSIAIPFTIGLLGLLLSGSRASLLMVVVILFALGRAGSRPARAILWVTGALMLVVVAFGMEFQFLGEIVRTNNSRESGWESALHSLRDYPWWGQGYQVSGVRSGVAGSPLTAAVEAGIVGLLSLAVMVLTWARGAYLCGRVCVAFTVGMCAHSLFESWLVSLGSPMMLLAICVWFAGVSGHNVNSIGQEDAPGSWRFVPS